MVKLNLVPEKVRAAAALMVIVMVGLAVYVLLAGGVGWAYFSLRAQLKEVRQQSDLVRAELDSPELRDTVKEVELFTAQNADLNVKKELVNLLRKRQVYAVRLLDVLPDLLPPRVWLSKIDQTEDARSGRRVMVEGFASGPEPLADLVANLESHGQVSKLRVDDSPVKATQLSREVIKFKLSFTFEDLL